MYVSLSFEGSDPIFSPSLVVVVVGVVSRIEDDRFISRETIGGPLQPRRIFFPRSSSRPVASRATLLLRKQKAFYFLSTQN